MPDGSALTDNAASAEIARYQSGIIICCKNSHGHEERFRHGDVAGWRTAAANMKPPPTIAEFDYGLIGWSQDLAAVAAGQYASTEMRGDGVQRIWENHLRQPYDAHSYLVHCKYPLVGYIRYDILSCYDAKGRMSDPHNDTEHNPDLGHKMFYPHCPGATQSSATVLFGRDNPPPLCDYPRYAKMELLRSAVNTGQRYDSSTALYIALSAQQYKLPQFKQPMPSLPRVRVLSLIHI